MSQQTLVERLESHDDPRLYHEADVLMHEAVAYMGVVELALQVAKDDLNKATRRIAELEAAQQQIDSQENLEAEKPLIGYKLLPLIITDEWLGEVARKAGLFGAIRTEPHSGKVELSPQQYREQMLSIVKMAFRAVPESDVIFVSTAHAHQVQAPLNGLHDNKATMSREMWHEGRMLWHTTAAALAQIQEYKGEPAFGTYPDVPRAAVRASQPHDSVAIQSDATDLRNEGYDVICDRRDLFDFLRSAWRNGQDHHGDMDESERWDLATQHATKAIKGWSTLRHVAQEKSIEEDYALFKVANDGLKYGSLESAVQDREHLEAAIANVLEEKTMLSTDAIDEISPALADVIQPFSAQAEQVKDAARSSINELVDRLEAVKRLNERETTCTPEILDMFNDQSLPEISKDFCATDGACFCSNPSDCDKLM